MLDRALAALGEDDSVERCALLALRAAARPDARGDADATAAEKMAARLGSDVADRHLQIRAVRTAIGRGDFETAYAMASTATSALPTTTGEYAGQLLIYKRWTALCLGDLGRATEAADEMLVVACERHVRQTEAIVLAQRVVRLLSR